MKKHPFVLNTTLLALLAAFAHPAMSAPNDVLEEVTVSSTTIDDRFSAKRGEASSVSTIRGETVEAEHGKNILDVLESIPGVTAELQSGDSVKIMLRGVEAQRYMGESPGVAIVIDGVPVKERTGRVNIDLDNIESIKVIKGGASYLYGEDALSGAVVITTKRGAKMAGLSVSTEGGTFRYRKGVVRAGFARGDWIGHIQTSNTQSLDYYYQGGYFRDYTDGKLQYLVNEHSDLTFGFEQSKRAKDSHGTVRGVTNALIDPRSFNSPGAKDFARKYDIGLDKMFLTYANDLGDGYNLMLNTYRYKDHTNFWSGSVGYAAVGATRVNMSTLLDAYTSQNDQNQLQRGIKAELRKDSERFGYLAGLDIGQNNDRQNIHNLIDYYTSPVGGVLRTAGTTTSDFMMRTKTNAAYGEGKFRLTDPLTLTVNARYDDIGMRYSDYLNALELGTNFRVWSERVGASYALDAQREIYANLSNGFRTPTVQQLYAGTITPTNVVASNPNLRPERAWNQEIGARVKSEWFGIGVDVETALFQIDRKNFILNVGGQYAAPGTAVGSDQYQNIGGVRNRGLELAVKTDRKLPFSVDVAYTYLDAKFTKYDSFFLQTGARGAFTYTPYNNTGHVVPRSPRHKLNLAGHYSPLPGLTLTTEINAQSGLYADELNWMWIGGRAITNLMASYDVKSGPSSKWSVFARADNLFNRYYYSTVRGSGDANADGKFNAEDLSITVNQGRVLTAGLTATF
ncbi:MAG: TonB-dependent receptor [Nitrosomonadales bacterium]|nr:TonB-dependent receptor [Nitrosomonadales bacterium]